MSAGEGPVTAPGWAEWQEANDWAESVTWERVSLDGEPPLYSTGFDSGVGGWRAALLVAPGRIAVQGRIIGLDPGQARRLATLLAHAITMSEHAPPPPVDNPAPPVDNGGQE